MPRVKDTQTIDMFAIPQPEGDLPCSMDYCLAVSGLVSQVLKAADGDRYAVAADMSRLAGKEISKNSLDAWSSGARDDHNIPFYLVPVLEKASHSRELTNWLADKRGGKVSFGKEAFDAEIGKLERMKAEAAQRIKALKKQMGEVE